MKDIDNEPERLFSKWTKKLLPVIMITEDKIFTYNKHGLKLIID